MKAALVPRPATYVRGLSHLSSTRQETTLPQQIYLVYMDEFGHTGPYISRQHPQHNTFPVFGFGGIIIPASQVRAFSSWFYQLKCKLLDFEIKESGKQAHLFEKKGAQLFTTKNVLKYRELRQATFSIFNKIESCGGRILYTGIDKFADPSSHNSNGLTFSVLRTAIRRLDGFCADVRDSAFLLFLDRRDEETYRESLITVTQQEMYGNQPSWRLLEAPTQIESHRYQLMQAADWMCGLIGRIETYHARAAEYPELNWTDKYFTQRLQHIAVRSGIHKATKPIPLLPENPVPCNDGIE